MSGKNKIAGDTGEAEVIKLVQCPNCGKPLQKLPPNYPLYDVQCIGCSFRAQVKTNLSKPKSTVFGAGWEIIDKVLKAGFLSPPLFLNFKWIEKGVRYQEIRFYPFVPRKNIQKYRLSPRARRANYWMFRYVGMNGLPYFTLYAEGHGPTSYGIIKISGYHKQLPYIKRGGIRVKKGQSVFGRIYNSHRKSS